MTKKNHVCPGKEVPRDIVLCWDERSNILLGCYADEEANALRPRRTTGYYLGPVASLDEVFTAIVKRFPEQGTPSKDALERLRSKSPDIPFPVTLFWAVR